MDHFIFGTLTPFLAVSISSFCESNRSIKHPSTWRTLLL